MLDGSGYQLWLESQPALDINKVGGAGRTLGRHWGRIWSGRVRSDLGRGGRSFGNESQRRE